MKLYSRILTGYFKEKPVSLNYTTRHVQPTMNQPILGTINEGEGVESWIWGVTWIGSSAAIAPSSQLYVTAFQPPSFALLSFPSRRRCTPVLCSPVFHLSPKKKKHHMAPLYKTSTFRPYILARWGPALYSSTRSSTVAHLHPRRIWCLLAR